MGDMGRLWVVLGWARAGPWSAWGPWEPWGTREPREPCGLEDTREAQELLCFSVPAVSSVVSLSV